MKRMILWLILVISIFSSTSVLAEDLGSILDKLLKVAPILMDNKQVGSLFSDGMMKQYGLDTNQQNQARVNNIGRKLLSSLRITKPYDFKVLATDNFNACSIYGGHIMVFRGLVNDTRNSDSELAFAIAHEIMHNEKGHNQEAVNTFKITYALQLLKVTNNLPALLSAAANAVLAGRSREWEKEADQGGFEALSQGSKSELKGSIAMFRRIEAEHKLELERSGKSALDQRFAQIFATHPEPSERVEAAEDSYFLHKYNNTFKEIQGAETKKEGYLVKNTSTNPLVQDAPIIMAHPCQWETPLQNINKIHGIGLFNPASILKEAEEVNTYLEILAQGNFVAVTCDNDYHQPAGKLLEYNYTYIQASDTSETTLLPAIKNGQTYAVSEDLQLIKENFRMGCEYPKVKEVNWHFSFASSLPMTVKSNVIVYRNGEKIAEISPKSDLMEFEFSDNPKAGLYWYVLYIPKRFITSPITVEVTRKKNDPIDFRNDLPWHKGIVHCHSDHSDGHSRLALINQERERLGLEFIFMTDHDDCFGQNVNHKLPKKIPSHPHGTLNPYQNYVSECKALPQLFSGIEFALDNASTHRHLLVLGQEEALPYQNQTEAQFFGGSSIETATKTSILPGPCHLGDDVAGSEIEQDAVFSYSKTNSTLKLRVKGSPRKDPILWINRREIGRIVTTDDKWHWYEFPVNAEGLNNGQNLFHIESYIPDRWQTFDDCEFADVWIYPR